MQAVLRLCRDTAVTKVPAKEVRLRARLTEAGLPLALSWGGEPGPGLREAKIRSGGLG